MPSPSEPSRHVLKHPPTAGELADLFRHLSSFPEDESIDLAKVAQYYHAVVGPKKLREKLQEIFSQAYPIPPLHDLLARVPSPLLIVTTNYDDLIERAFDRAGKPFHLAIHTVSPRFREVLLWRPSGSSSFSTISPKKLDCDLSKMTVIYKMHGSVLPPAPPPNVPSGGEYVITEDDYVDFVTRMTTNNVIPSIFAEPFQTRPFLFLGYSLSDWNFRVVLNRIRLVNRAEGESDAVHSWAIQLKPTPIERTLWNRRNVTLYPISIDTFVENLRA